MKISGKFILKVAGTLTIISLVVALLLGLVNGVTADKIAAMNAAATQTALEAVTEAGSTYDEITSIPQEVMDAAKEYGARGGTVIHARGTASGLAEKKFEIAVQPEKEMVMILVPSEIKDDVLHGLYRAVGLKTPGQGIAFSLPVDAAVGLVENAETTEQKSEK